MVTDDALATYLNDHLSGAMAGVDLAAKSAAENEGTPFGSFMAGLRDEIEEDRATLVAIMERLGIGPATIKQMTAKIIEKLSRVKLHESVTGDPDLSRLMELETLDIGVTGKLALWRTLREIARVDARLAGTDFGELTSRAGGQLERIGQAHLETARQLAA